MDMRVMRMLWCNQTSSQQQKAGFTLIELLVTTALSMILAGGALAAYNNFNSQQGFVQNSKNVIADFERARARSLAGEKPDDCPTLAGYRVRGAASTTTYFLSVRCEGATPEIEVEQEFLPTGYTFSDSFDIVFPPYPGPVSTVSQTINIAKSDDSRVYRFIIEKNGVIEDVGLVTP